MGGLKTHRPYQERFLDNFDRSQLRREVEAVKPRKQRFSGMKKKYATWALGASLALGGIGAPLKMVQSQSGGNAGGSGSQETATTMTLDSAMEKDLKAAKSIASQVAGGVAAAVEGVETVASSPLQAVAEAP